MSINIRYPQISGVSEKEQITQIKSYLHQLVEQLNNELPNIGSGDGTTQSTGTKSTSTYEVQGGEVSYYDLRSLIVQELQKVENMIDELEQARDNGEFDGADGKDGKDGYTPVKGVDYFTENEVASVAGQAAEKISFTVDENGNLYYEVEE
jgi:hypothetical protein